MYLYILYIAFMYVDYGLLEGDVNNSLVDTLSQKPSDSIFRTCLPQNHMSNIPEDYNLDTH
jgi:hypothetical protein